MTTKMFVNLPVKDLETSITFYRTLGFAFNPQFTDDTAACMIVSEQNYIMLLTYDKFRQFTSKPIADAHVLATVHIAIALESVNAVDDMVVLAIDAGGIEPRPKVNHGFMVQRTFEDPDGHTWEPFWMDPAAFQQGAA